MCGSLKSRVEDFCIACKIFGTAGEVSVTSKVKFRGACSTQKAGELLERTGIAIEWAEGTMVPF